MHKAVMCKGREQHFTLLLLQSDKESRPACIQSCCGFEVYIEHRCPSVPYWPCPGIQWGLGAQGHGSLRCLQKDTPFCGNSQIERGMSKGKSIAHVRRTTNHVPQVQVESRCPGRKWREKPPLRMGRGQRHVSSGF